MMKLSTHLSSSQCVALQVQHIYLQYILFINIVCLNIQSLLLILNRGIALT